MRAHCDSTPSHQDPAGVMMPLGRRKALLAWAKDHCDFVIEDAWDSDYYYAAPLHQLYMSQIEAENTTIHQVNECVKLADIDLLSSLYQRILEKLML